MEHVFTSEQILAYVYGELDAETTAKLEYALTRDGSLREAVINCRDNKALLDHLPQISPSDKTVANILRYAEQKTEEQSLEMYQ